MNTPTALLVWFLGFFGGVPTDLCEQVLRLDAPTCQAPAPPPAEDGGEEDASAAPPVQRPRTHVSPDAASRISNGF